MLFLSGRADREEATEAAEGRTCPSLAASGTLLLGSREGPPPQEAEAAAAAGPPVPVPVLTPEAAFCKATARASRALALGVGFTVRDDDRRPVLAVPLLVLLLAAPTEVVPSSGRSEEGGAIFC